jgi:hypothetical protein
LAWKLCLLFACLWATAQADVSFYGQRSVIIDPHPSIQPDTFHQRAVSPSSRPPADTEQDTAIRSTTIPEQSISLTRNERLLAKKALYYLDQNRQTQTGLWDSVQGYPHTTLWDIASGIAGMLSAEALALKPSEQVRDQLRQTLITLKKMPLYKNILPNREYSTQTGRPSGRLSQTQSHGSGWSALDIGRLLIWLKILNQQHQEFAQEVQVIINRWQLGRAVKNGTLYGTNLYRGKEYYRQEGRNGYLQYAATGFDLFGHPIGLPDLATYLQTVTIAGIALQVDSRNVPFMTSDPYVLAGIEFGIDPAWNQLETIYQLHRKRWLTEHRLFCYAEDAMDKNPWFAYNNLYYYGKAWISVSPSGKVIENPQIFSHKMAYGFSVLFDDAYSKALGRTVLDHSLHFRSIPTGIYADGGSNTAFNINTNATILVALWYKHRGKKPILQRPTH